MSNPFSDLQTAFANASGFDPIICGFILGLALTFVILICFMWILDPEGKDRSGFSMYVGIFVAMVVNTIVGWFPIWVPLVATIFVAFIVIDPFGSSSRGNA